MVLDEIRDLEGRIDRLEKQLKATTKQDPAVQRLLEIPGIGLLTATALAASAGDAKHFRSGRHMAAWLGLTPREFSSGNNRHLGANIQARRRLPQNITGPWCTHCFAPSPAIGQNKARQSEPIAAVGCGSECTRRAQQSRCRPGQQNGQNRLGHLGSQPTIQRQLRCRLITTFPVARRQSTS